MDVDSAGSEAGVPVPGSCPNFPGALDLKDIQPGMRVIVRHARGGLEDSVRVVMAEPFERVENNWHVEVLYRNLEKYSSDDIASGRIAEDDKCTVWLVDMGVTPYRGFSGDFWHPNFFTLKAE